jgi:hypothetical protein
MGFTLPENLKIVSAMDGINAANALGGDYVSLKNAHKAWLVFQHDGTNDTDLTVGVNEATTVAGGSATAITATMPIWVDSDAGTQSDTLVRQTDAANYVIDPATEGTCLLVIEVDPAKLSAGFDCVAVVGTGGHASNNVSAHWYLESRYPGDQPPSAIVD